MKNVLGIVGILVFFISNCWANNFLQPLQGEWVITKIAYAPIGGWSSERGNCCIGDKLVIIGNDVYWVLCESRYKCDLSNISYVSQKIKLGDSYDFDVNEKGIDPKDLGLTKNQPVILISTMDFHAFPFMSFTYYGSSKNLILLLDGAAFLFKRLKTTNLQFPLLDTDCENGWAHLNSEEINNRIKAIESFQQAIDKNPQNANAYFGWGYVLYRNRFEENSNNANEAIEKFNIVLKLDTASTTLKKAAKANIDDIQDEKKVMLSITPAFK
jgi:tetratricopeptide (TPR) repeat protein